MGGNTNRVRTARDTLANERKLISLNTIQSTSALLRKILANDVEELERIRQELALIETVPLRIHKRRSRYVFGIVPEGKSSEQGITKDKERIHQLARRDYIKNREAIIELRLKQVKAIIDTFDEVAYEQRLAKKLARYSNAGLDFTRILFTKEQNEWIDEPYNPNPYHQENLIHATTNNMCMRSGAEAAIGSKVESVGLPYRYDDFVEIGTNARAKAYRSEDVPFRESYFVDFKVPNLLGGITIHEHLGAFHVTNYGDSSLKRLNDYHNFGVMEIPGRPVKHSEFTWSFANDVRNEDTLDQLLARMLLPGLL